MKKIIIQNYNELKKIIREGNIPLETLDISAITDMRNIISNDNNLSLLLVKSFSLCGLFEALNKINGDISIQANEPWRVRKWDANERIINNSLLIVNEDKR